MTRIIGGGGKGRRLKTPKGQGTRPTGARVRQTLFDILAARVPDSSFLDAFAGSGGVGLEALSRGAREVVLVDASRDAVAALRENVRALSAVPGEALVHQQDALTALRGFAREGRVFDLVYLDPPYESDLYEPLLRALGEKGLLAPDGLAVAEHFHKRVLPETIGGLARSREVRVGDHRLSFYRLTTAEGE